MISFNSYEALEGARILITGGTGSLGRQLARTLLRETETTIVLIYSRDEFKQFEMEKTFGPEEARRLRFLLGDVRDLNRLRRALDG
ncbi:MAG: polysaccharide biosynthesis protein, partial [Verrucomicrobiota bacterium]